MIMSDLLSPFKSCDTATEKPNKSFTVTLLCNKPNMPVLKNPVPCSRICRKGEGLGALNKSSLLYK